eukprot:COSAG02_NODE_493_length_21166_cov_13.181318_5_plen_125_part_00
MMPISVLICEIKHRLEVARGCTVFNGWFSRLLAIPTQPVSADPPGSPAQAAVGPNGDARAVVLLLRALVLLVLLGTLSSAGLQIHARSFGRTARCGARVYVRLRCGGMRGRRAEWQGVAWQPWR